MVKSSPSKAKVGRRIVRRHARKVVEGDKRRRGVEILHTIFQIYGSLDLYRELCITNALSIIRSQQCRPQSYSPSLLPTAWSSSPSHLPYLQHCSISLHRPNAPTQTMLRISSRHRLQARGRTDLSSPSPRASDYAGSVGVSSTSTTIRWVQSGMVVPDKPSMGHAVVFWLNQYAFHRLFVKAAWNVYAMGQ